MASHVKFTKVVCCHSRYGPPVRTPYRVVVENLSSRVSWQVNDMLLWCDVETVHCLLTPA